MTNDLNLKILGNVKTDIDTTSASVSISNLNMALSNLRKGTIFYFIVSGVINPSVYKN
jgi:hypothetical protein